MGTTTNAAHLLVLLNFFLFTSSTDAGAPMISDFTIPSLLTVGSSVSINVTYYNRIPGYQSVKFGIGKETVQRAFLESPTWEKGTFSRQLDLWNQSTDDADYLSLTLKQLTEEDNGVRVSVYVKYKTTDHFQTSILNVTNCSSSVTRLSYNGIPHFGKNASVECSNSMLYVDGEANESGLPYYATCSQHARWDGGHNFSCWFAPIPELQISPMSTGGSGLYRESQTLNISCMAAPGFPLHSDTKFKINRVAEGIQEFTNAFQLIRLNYQDHLSNITCFANNSYGNNTEFKVLHVEFEPRILNATCQNADPSGGSMVQVSIIIIGNPIDKATNGTLRLSDDETYNNGSWGKGEEQLTYKLNMPNPHETAATFTVRIYSTPNKSNSETFTLNLSCEEEEEEATPTESVPVTVTHTPDTSNWPQDSTNSQQSTTASFGRLPSLSVGATISQQSSNANSVPPASSLSEGAIAGIAGGGFLLLVLTTILIIRIVHRRKATELAGDANVNPAFVGSSGSQANPEHENRENILYVTSDDLKSGGGGSGEMVDNVLYGSTPAPRDTNGSDPNQELYSVVQKTKKTKGKPKGVDPGASTSGLQSDDTYAEVNKDRKKKKDGKKAGKGVPPGASTSGLQSDDTYAEVNKDRKKKKAGKGQENSGFAGDAQQDATYAVVDKKKNKGAKGKKADEPGTSGLVEEATYAVVNKKDKKPKKDGPDDDLHGSNKP